MKFLVLPFALLILFVSACGDSTSTSQESAVDTDAEKKVMTSSATKITLSPKAAGTGYADATITNWTYDKGMFAYEYDAATYKLGEQTPDASSIMCANSGKGQHIHLIVDNKPYAAKYSPAFEYDLDDGEYRVLSFLSRSYHESIKTEKAHRAANVTVKDKAFVSQTPITDPMLFYSRPKGTYTGKDTKELLLDFYTVNVELGSAYKVKVEVGDETFMLDTWQPYVLKGLPMGENTVTLTLVDAEGKKVDTPLNPVSRTFTLVADPLG